MRKKIGVFVFSLVIILTILFIYQKNIKIKQDCERCLRDFEIRRYEEMGKLGVGDAYVLIADNIVQTGRTDLGDVTMWWNRALRAGSTRQNIVYAHKLMDEAKRRSPKSPARLLLLDSAKYRLTIAISNSFMLPSYDDSTIEDRRSDIDLVNDDLIEISSLKK